MNGKRIKIESLLKAGFTILLTMIAVFTSCSQQQTISEQENKIEITGIIQVLSEGTRSETVIIEDSASGITYALVGENAIELASAYGLQVIVLGEPTEVGWTIETDLPKLTVISFTIIEEESEENDW